jgi:hypothetical protein
MNIKIILFSFLLTPFFAASQTIADSMQIDASIFSIPSSLQCFQLIKDKKVLDKSFFEISFTPIKSKNIRALRAGALESQDNYSIVLDTTYLNPTKLEDSDSLQEVATLDSSQIEHFFVIKYQNALKKNPNQKDLNYLFQIGDWTESMYLLSKYVKKERDMTVASLIIDQEQSVDLITAKLIELNFNNDLTEIIISFQKLQFIYDSIERKHKNLKPKTDKKTKTTTIRSKTVIQNTRKSFVQIENELNILRDKIYNHTDNQ